MTSPKPEWLQQFSPARLAALSDAEIASGLEGARSLAADAAKGVVSADHALLVARITLGSAAGDPAVRAKYAEQENLDKKIKRARQRRREAERAVAWTQLLFWRRRRAQMDHESAVALLAQLEKMWGETARWLQERELACTERHEAHRVAAQDAAKRAAQRAAQADKAVVLLEDEQRSRRVSALIRAVARMADLPLAALRALLLEAMALRDAARSDMKAKRPGARELHAQLRDLVAVIEDEIDGRNGGGGGTPPGDMGDGGGNDGQGGGPNAPSTPGADRPKG